MRASDDHSLRHRNYLRSVLTGVGVLFSVAVAMAACSGGSNQANCTGQGCDCGPEGATIDCGETTARGSDSVTCRKGTRTCEGGKWGACVGNSMSIRKYETKGTTPSPCTTNPCDPGCRTFDDVPGDIDGGLVSGPDGGLTLPETSDAVWTGGAGCTGLECQIDLCGGDYTQTQLTGQVYDPAGKNPVYGVLVYIPNASLTPLTEGVSCDSCATPSGSPIVSALTDYTGTFRLKGVPNGTNIPIVIQSGKWRRELTIPSVTKCVSNSTNSLTGADGLKLLRFPKNRSEGNIPRIAFVSGSADPFQCLLMKMGMDVSATSAEIGPPILSGSTNPDRIHYYQSTSGAGQDLSATLGGPGASASTLWDTAAHLDQYDAIILACEGNQYDKGSTVNQLLVDYSALGGRIFTTHYSYSYLQYAPAATNWPNVVTYWNHTSVPVTPMTTILNRTFSKGDAFARWLSYTGASPTLGQLAIQEGRHDYDYVDRTRATPWMYSNSDGSLPTGTLLLGGSPCMSGSECASGTCTGAATTTTILNGSFESGLTSWTTAGGAVSTAGTPRTGTAGLRLGSSSPGADNSASQTFTSPATGGNLNFYYRMSCSDVGYDYMTVTLTDNSTGIVTALVPATCTTTATWQSVTAPLIASRSYTVKFLMHEYPDWILPSYATFDDVTVGTLGACSGTAVTSCTIDTDCPGGGTSGAGCWNGVCVPAHQQEALMTFNTPIGAAPAAQCGRVVYSDFHVSASALNGTSFTFPEGCNTGDLTAQEKALEFMLFDLTACLTPDYVPPTPPKYAPVTVSRDYTASCPIGSRPTWHFFDWKTETPSDSNIVFTVQTGDTTAEVTAMPALPLATVSGAPITTWTGADVATVLAAASPPVPNGLILRVNITLNPSTDKYQAPTLVDWRQAFTCVPVE